MKEHNPDSLSQAGDTPTESATASTQLESSPAEHIVEQKRVAEVVDSSSHPVSVSAETQEVSPEDALAKEAKAIVSGAEEFVLDPQRNISQEMGIQGVLQQVLERVAAPASSQDDKPFAAPVALEAEVTSPSSEANVPAVVIASPEEQKLSEMPSGSTETLPKKRDRQNKDRRSGAKPSAGSGGPDETEKVTDIPEVGSTDWYAQFAELSELAYADVVSKLQAGEVVSGVRLPFLNLTGMTFAYPLLFDRCDMVGLAIRGVTCEQGISLQHCWVRERILISDAQKIEPYLNSTIHGGIRLENCCLEANVSVTRATVIGDVQIRQCRADVLAWDRCTIDGSIQIHDCSAIKVLSCFRTKISGHLVAENSVWQGKPDGTAIDLKQASVAGFISMSCCEVGGKADLSRLYVGSGIGKALVMEECKFAEVILIQAKLSGDTRIQDCTFAGEFSANPPRGDEGQRAGRSCLFEGELSVTGCEFQDKVHFQYVRTMKQAYFSHCALLQGGNFNQAHFGQGVSFWESSVEKEIHFRKTHFQGLANFGHTTLAHRSSFNEAIFDDTATFFESQFEGDVFFSSAIFAKECKMGRLKCAGGLIMQKIQVGGQLNLLQAQIRDRLILSESQLGSLHAPALGVGTWASLASSVVEGEVVLEGCKVGTAIQPSTEPTEYIPGSFYIDHAIFHHDLKMTGSDIRGALSLEDVNAHREVELINVRVGQDLTLSKGYFREVLRCEAARIKGNLWINRSRFRNEVSCNDVECNNASLSGSSFDQGLTIRSATIADCLTLNNVDVDGKIDLSKCSFQRFFFDHLLVDYLMIDRSQLGETLASERAGNYAQAQNEYGILRQAFQNRNQYPDMDWAYYRFCQARRKAKKQDWTTGLEWLFLDLGFGYGTRPMNIAGVALAIVVVFAGMFALFPHGIVDRVGNVLTSISLLDALHLSVMSFASLEYSPQQPHATHWLRYLFTLEGLFGIFLITLFVATISRKIIRT